MQRYWRLKTLESDPDTGRRKKARYETVSWATEAYAEEVRVQREAELRLGIPGSARSTGWSTRELMAWFVIQTDLGTGSEAHKSRATQDAANIARLIGRVSAERLGDEHVRQYMALRSNERVVKIRQRMTESNHAWRSRLSAARGDPDGKPISSTTIRNELRTLRTAMTMAYESGQLDNRPIRLPRPKAMRKDHRPPRRLTEDEIAELLRAAQASEADRPVALAGLADLVEVLAFSGRRPKAIYGLRRRDVPIPRLRPRRDDRAPKVFWRDDKGGEGRGWGPVTRRVAVALLRRVEALGGAPRTTLLWTTQTGRPLSSNQFPKVFKRYVVDRSTIDDVRPYDLRKFACSRLLVACGGNAHEAVQFTGHSTVEVFMTRYAYAFEAGIARAAEWSGC